MKQHGNEADVARARKAKAEQIIWATTVASATGGLLPLGTSVVVFISANVGMIIALGHLYGLTTTKEQAAQLIKHILAAVGTTYALGLYAMKLGFEVAKFLGVFTAGAATIVACGVDAVLSGALSFALGYTALAYFKADQKMDHAEIRRLFVDFLAEGKKRVKDHLKGGGEKTAPRNTDSTTTD